MQSQFRVPTSRRFPGREVKLLALWASRLARVKPSFSEGLTDSCPSSNYISLSVGGLVRGPIYFSRLLALHIQALIISAEFSSSARRHVTCALGMQKNQSAKKKLALLNPESLHASLA